MPARKNNNKLLKNQRAASSKPQPRATKSKRAPGAGLDRSTEAVIEAAHPRMKPAPPGALPDRRTAEAKRRG